MLPSTILTAIALALAGTSDAYAGRHVKLTFRRYAPSDDDCQKNPIGLSRLHLHDGEEIKEGHCRSFDEPFNNFAFNWRGHAGEDRPTNKDCTLEVFADKGCKGMMLHSDDDAVAWYADDNCKSLDWPGGQSISLSCKKNGRPLEKDDD